MGTRSIEIPFIQILIDIQILQDHFENVNILVEEQRDFT